MLFGERKFPEESTSMHIKKIILVDQDGVLANYQAHHLALWRLDHPEKFWIPLEAVSDHHMDNLYPDELKKVLRTIPHRKDFFRDLPVIDGGKEALEEMLACGHDVRICTSPLIAHQFCVPEKYAWVEKNLGHKWTERIIMTRDKTLVHGDILIDDKPNIVGVRTPTWKHILYDQPYNRHITGQDRLTWENYKEVLER